MRLLPFVFACTALAAGCGKKDPPTPLPPPEAPAVPATRPGTLRVEGVEVPVTLEKIDLPEAPFTTFVPESTFAARAQHMRTGTEVWFRGREGRFGADAYVWFTFSEGGTVDSVRDFLLRADGVLAREGLVTQIGPSPCLWAEDGGVVATEDGQHSGFWCLGTHAEQPFFLVTRHPAEASEGFGPRLDVLLDAFRWRDTGGALAGE